MFAADQYIQLLSSLPQFAPLFSAKQTPLSRLKLDQRLKLLSPHDQQRLAEIEAVLEWDNISLLQESNALTARFRQVLAIEAGSDIESIIRSRLDMRTLVAALNLRANGKQPEGDWTASELKRSIERNWQSPTFKLEHHYSWLKQAVQYFNSGQYLLLEKLLFNEIWKYLQSHPSRRQYSFTSVVIYVLQWDVASRWLSYDSQAALVRFNLLLESALPSKEQFSELTVYSS